MSYFNILGLTKEAERVGKEALQHSNDPSLMFNLANILGKQDKFKESEAAFLKAIHQSSHDSRYYANLGKVDLYQVPPLFNGSINCYICQSVFGTDFISVQYRAPSTN